MAEERPGVAVSLIRAIVVSPASAEALNQLALAVLRTGQHIPALQILVRSLAVRRDLAETHLNCGGVLFELAEWDQAIGCYERALEFRPDYAEAHANRAGALQSLGRVDEARPGYERALALNPGHTDAHANLATLDQASGDTAAAIRRFKRALSIDPRRPQIHSNLLFTLTYAENVDDEAIYRAFRDWERRHAQPLYAEARPHDNDRDPDRRLKVGYLSADLRDHPVAHNLIASLERHDRREVELTLYALLPGGDEMTERFRGIAERWRWVGGQDEHRIAAQIREDRIDVLVMMAPHTADNRPLVAALKPAPVQVALYDLTTTGMAAVDAWITDPLIHPPGETTERFVETLIRVPCLVNHAAPSPSPPLVRPPSAVRGRVTFGSFNNPAKVTDRVIALWAEVLDAVPGSRLLLKYLSRYGSPEMARLIGDRFAAHGIGPDRLELRSGRLPRMAQLALLNEVDIALDPFPFNGCTTTFEALWMGVPVVTLEGSRFLGRMSGSFLRHVGLGDLVAGDAAAYVGVATGLAGDLDRRSALRRELRDRLLASPLCDADAHARSLVAAYRRLWRDWCSGTPSGSSPLSAAPARYKPST